MKREKSRKSWCLCTRTTTRVATNKNAISEIFLINIHFVAKKIRHKENNNKIVRCLLKCIARHSIRWKRIFIAFCACDNMKIHSRTVDNVIISFHSTKWIIKRCALDTFHSSSLFCCCLVVVDAIAFDDLDSSCHRCVHLSLVCMFRMHFSVCAFPLSRHELKRKSSRTFAYVVLSTICFLKQFPNHWQTEPKLIAMHEISLMWTHEFRLWTIKKWRSETRDTKANVTESHIVIVADSISPTTQQSRLHRMAQVNTHTHTRTKRMKMENKSRRND